MDSTKAWDDVEWTEEQLAQAEESIAKQKQHPVPLDKQFEYNASPAEFWNKTYAQVT